MAREDCPFRWSILDRQTQASLILHGLPDRINKGGCRGWSFPHVDERLKAALLWRRAVFARHSTIGHNHDV